MVTQHEAVAHHGLLLGLIECEHPDRAIVNAQRVVDLTRRPSILRPKARRLVDSLRDLHPTTQLIVADHNAFVTTGLSNSVKRHWGIGGTAIGFIALDSNALAVTLATTQIHGSANPTNPATTLNGATLATAATFVVTAGTNIEVGMGFTIAAGGGTLETGVVSAVAGTTITPQVVLSSAHATGTAVSFLGQSIKAISPAATETTPGTVAGGATWTPTDFAAGGGNAVFAFNKIGVLATATDAGTGLIDVVGGAGTGIFARPFTVNLAYAGFTSATFQIAESAVAA